MLERAMDTTLDPRLAAEYAHRTGERHARTTLIALAARFTSPQAHEAHRADSNHARHVLISSWRLSHATWTRRRPPAYLHAEYIVQAPVPGTVFLWTLIGHETYVYKLVVHRTTATAITLRDQSSRAAYRVVTYEKLNAEYVPAPHTAITYRWQIGVAPTPL